MTKKKGDYKVGYGRTPEHTRFKPGQGGNRKGRPKGAQNLKTILEEELVKSRIPVTEGGVRRKVSKLRAMIKKLVNSGLTNSDRAAEKLLELYAKFADPPVPEFKNLSIDDKEILDAFRKRMNGSERKPPRSKKRVKKK